jgi:hypothetical protein
MIQRRLGTAICCIVLIGCSATVFGQQNDPDVGQEKIDPERSGPNPDESIAVGPFLFSPAVQLNWQYRDNIFFTPTDEVADQVYTARARLQFELPVSESFLLFSYTPQYRDYQDYELDDKWSHFVDFLGGFVFSNGLLLDTTYKYMVGNLENREVDPGGELFWGDRWYKKHFAALNLSYWISGTDGINFMADYTDVDHEDPDLWYPYTQTVIGAGWLHHLSEILVMNLAYRHTDFTPDDTFSFRDSSSDEVTVGFRGMVNAVLKADVVVGYRRTTYDVQAGDPDIPDFSGLIARGFLNWDLGHGSSVRLDVLRSDYPSNYGVNANYVATGGSFQYQYEKNRFRGQARARYQVNDYAVPDILTGQDREDPITTFGLGLGYRFGPYLSLWGGYLYENRDSTIYRYSYDYNVVTLGLVIGY